MSTKLRLVSDNVCVGLELEYEGIPYTSPMTKYGEVYRRPLLAFSADGSLRPRRENTEIKFSGPLAGPLVLEALDQIQEVLRWHKHRLSWRCGMHVHVDCRGLDFMQPYRAAILTALIEPVLFGWDGTGRQENKFCQSIADSVWAYCGDRRKFPMVTKYAVVNLKSLLERCSLELRFASSTKDIGRMAAFINVGLGLRDSVAHFRSGEELIDSVLSAPSIATWLRQNTHELFAAELEPTARAMEFREPTVRGLTAALTLCEFESKIEPTIIGGQ